MVRNSTAAPTSCAPLVPAQVPSKTPNNLYSGPGFLPPPVSSFLCGRPDRQRALRGDQAIFLRDISFCENEKFVPEAPLRLKERCGRRHTPRSCRQRAGGRARGRARGASIRVSAGAGRGAAARTRGGLQTMT